MQSCSDAAIDGFNTFLKEQQETEGLAKLTLVLFDDEYFVAPDALPVAGVTLLDTTTFVSRGTTALLDAIGETIDLIGAREKTVDATQCACRTFGLNAAMLQTTATNLVGKLGSRWEQLA